MCSVNGANSKQVDLVFTTQQDSHSALPLEDMAINVVAVPTTVMSSFQREGTYILRLNQLDQCNNAIKSIHNLQL